MAGASLPVGATHFPATPRISAASLAGYAPVVAPALEASSAYAPAGVIQAALMTAAGGSEKHRQVRGVDASKRVVPPSQDVFAPGYRVDPYEPMPAAGGICERGPAGALAEAFTSATVACVPLLGAQPSDPE
jgi:hypothetical protein